MPWLTPDSVPDDVAPIVLFVPDGESWLAAVRGALFDLARDENWEEFGALTPEQVSARYLDMWEDMFMPFPVVGAIVMWPTNSAPNRWLICDGQAVDRATYSQLFALIGTTYGAGNGSTTFNLPNLKGRFVVGRDSGNARWDTLAETGGQETQSHSHTLNNGAAINSRAISGSQFPAWQDASQSASEIFSNTTGTSTVYTVVKSMDSQPIETLPPYFALNFIICATAS